MIYRHKYFKLDPKSRKVFDENNKELFLTGNSFRLLVFLCEKKNANLTEIGDYLDWASNYTENHIRQYRYKINTIIGHNVIEYKNGIYSLIGKLEELEDGNTDLLQDNSIKSEENIINKNMETKITKFSGVIASILLLIALFDLPYGYYTFLRLIITIVAVYCIVNISKLSKELNFWFWSLIAIAILFNPLVPIHLGDKTVWGFIDVGVAVYFLLLVFKFKKILKIKK